MKLIVVFVAVLCLSCCVHAVKVDMGTCTCNCASGMGETISSNFLPGITHSRFYESIRGLKGDMGRPGETGPTGSPGTQGVQGLRGPPAVDISKQQDDNSIASCANLNAEDSAPGVYKIKPRGSAKEMQVYCETSVAGGGWTLVASIHENNIYGKCTAGDNWSSDQGITSQSNLTSLSNWENFKTFGHPEAATSNDYKSAAYYNLPSNDVMIWHVPNDSKMSQWNTLATLKYYTNNNFLSSYGGTLQALFSKYYPMKKLSEQEAGTEVEKIARRLAETSSNLRSLIPGFYSYAYDGGSLNQYISDGGSDMYDTGNKVFYVIGTGIPKQITYERHYVDFTSGTQVYSIKSHPFVTYMWIENTQRNVESFGIKVVSGTGADNNGRYDSTSSVVTNGNFSCQYNAYRVYSAGTDPSICEVYFYCYSEELWNSVPAATFTRSSWSSNTDNLINAVNLNGSPRYVLLGYTLLSRSSAGFITNSQIDNVLTRMIQDFQSITAFPRLDCSRLNESLAVPVQYLNGSNDDIIMNDIPPTEKSFVEPGYLHFRPLDLNGRPHALCPGIKSSSCNPSYICVGGVGVDSGESATLKRACGDYAGWQGRPTDNATATVPSGSARPLNNIESTLLIFTR